MTDLILDDDIVQTPSENFLPVAEATVNEENTPSTVNIEQYVERDVSDLMRKFNSDKPRNKHKPTETEPQQATLLVVPANRQATGFLQKAFTQLDQVHFGVDGEDHINISSVAKTRLGEFLDINAETPFEHRELSHFTSVGGLWYYVKGEVPDERFRYTWGDRNRLLGKKIKTRDVAGFKTIIADATWMKIISNPEVVADLVESTLPFKNYYYFGSLNLRKTTPEAIWYTAAIDEIRRTLKMRDTTGSLDLFPDFHFLESVH